MKSSHYLAIAVRLFSIVLFLYGLEQSSLLIEIIIEGSINDAPVSVLFGLAIVISPIIVSALLWSFPLSVSEIIIRPEIDKPIEPMNVHSLLTVFILAIGLYYFYFAIVESIYWITTWYLSVNSQNSAVPTGLSEESKASMVTSGIGLLVSIGVILKSRGLSLLLLKIAR
jgi:hypothetical protein